MGPIIGGAVKAIGDTDLGGQDSAVLRSDSVCGVCEHERDGFGGCSEREVGFGGEYAINFKDRGRDDEKEGGTVGFTGAKDSLDA